MKLNLKLIYQMLEANIDNKKNIYKINNSVFKELWEFFLKTYKT